MSENSILLLLLFIITLIVVGGFLFLKFGAPLLIEIINGFSDVFESFLQAINVYFVNFVNLLMLCKFVDEGPIIYDQFKEAFLHEQYRLEFQKRGVDNFYANINEVNALISKIGHGLDLFKSFLFFALIGGIFLDIYIQRKNRQVRREMEANNPTGSWLKKDTYDFTISFYDRFYSVGFYLLPVLDIYNRYGKSFFTMHPEYWPYQIVGQSVYGFFYEDLQTITFGLFLPCAFFFLFYGIGRNRDSFIYFIRYHAIQSIVFGLLFTTTATLVKFILYLQPEHGLMIAADWESELLVAFYFIASPMVLSAFVGLETRITGIDEAIQYHIGPRPPKRKKKK